MQFDDKSENPFTYFQYPEHALIAVVDCSQFQPSLPLSTFALTLPC